MNAINYFIITGAIRSFKTDFLSVLMFSFIFFFFEIFSILGQSINSEKSKLKNRSNYKSSYYDDDAVVS